MVRKVFLLLLTYFLTGCVEYSARPFFREWVDCGGGKFAASRTMCESRVLMFNSFY